MELFSSFLVISGYTYKIVYTSLIIIGLSILRIKSEIEIGPEKSLLKIPLKEIWLYRDLWRMYIVRDIVTVYKQTILGPVWFFSSADYDHPGLCSGVRKGSRDQYGWYPTTTFLPVWDRLLELLCPVPDTYFQYLSIQCRDFWQSLLPKADCPACTGYFKSHQVFDSGTLAHLCIRPIMFFIVEWRWNHIGSFYGFCQYLSS